jgi:CubicO group peptidase (beta-lactamase class C family)
MCICFSADASALIDGQPAFKDSVYWSARKWNLQEMAWGEACFAIGCKTAMMHETTPPPARPADPLNRFDAVYRILNDAIAAHAFPGCAFGVLAGGHIVLQDAMGRFTYEENAAAVVADTVFDVASLTKVAATTAAAMLLHQRGLLDLETSLGAMLPGFLTGRASADPARLVTLRHLLAHNSGLPGYVEFFRQVTTAASLIEALLRLPIETVPGNRAEYSDPGFMLLGKALEVCLTEPLAPWLQREVFGPLGMAATGFCPAVASRTSIPPTEEDTWFRHRRIQGQVQDENAWILGGVAGHAGLFSNVPDLLRFAQEVLATSGRAGKSRVFDAAAIERFAQRQGPEGSPWALGWDTPSGESTSGHFFSPHTIGHLGFSGSSLWIDLDAGVAVVLLTNRTWPDRKCQLIRQVRPAFHDAVRRSL